MVTFALMTAVVKRLIVYHKPVLMKNALRVMLLQNAMVTNVHKIQIVLQIHARMAFVQCVTT